jgi:molybdenum cofactor sulfurtransferase
MSASEMHLNLIGSNRNLKSIDAAQKSFMQAYPAYATTQMLDNLRDKEYSRLDLQNQVYLDYTGGGLYAESQLRKHMELLESQVFGNPHSENPTSLAMTRLANQARTSVLQFFNASSEYTAIFTPNATGALKLVGESYPFGSGSLYLLTTDNHNSVNGIREFARSKGAEVTYLPAEPPELRIDEDKLRRELDLAGTENCNLFAYPAQSNFSGVQHPLEWISVAQDRGWDVLLDSAAFVPTNRLDLGKWHPDFVAISFYKIFGYPTGVGCLLARKSSLSKLKRPWFSGGTITVASVKCPGCHYLSVDEAGFEDGTINYLNLPAVEIGLNHIQDIGIDMIHERVSCLTGWLLDNMQSMYHSNGRPLVRILGPSDLDRRGGTIAFDLLDADGRAFNVSSVQRLANKANISLRTGCFCNPGDGEAAHNLTREEIERCFKKGKAAAFGDHCSFSRDLDKECQEIKERASSIRISVGMATNFRDVYRFMSFLSTFCQKHEQDLDEEECIDSNGIVSP